MYPPAGRPSPAASVVIPAYRSEATIERSVRSALGQGSDVEVIVTDDGSTDRTADILRELAADDRVRTVRHETNRGLSAARNSAIEAAHAPHIVFLDADDELLPGAVKTLIAGFAPEVGIVCGRVDVRGDERPRRWPPDTFAQAYVEVDDLLRKNWLAVTGTAIRTDLVRDLGGFAPYLVQTQDYDLWLRAAARMRIRMLDDVVAVLYRDRPSLSSDLKAALLDRLVLLERLAQDVAPPGAVWAARARTAADLAHVTAGLERVRWRARSHRWAARAARDRPEQPAGSVRR